MVCVRGARVRGPEAHMLITRRATLALFAILCLALGCTAQTDDPDTVRAARADLVLAVESKVTVADAVTWDRFGYAVAIDGDTAAVGTPYDVSTGDGSGSVYVLVLSAGIWTQQAKLVPADNARWDLFGFSVAVRGDQLVAGAPRDDGAGGRRAGAAYVFVRSGTAWTEQAKLVPSDPGPDDRFGWSVAVDADRALVGAPYHAPAADVTGAAYVFARSGTAWPQETKLVATSPDAGDELGWAVAIEGTAILASAPHTADGVSEGAVHVFGRTGSVWTERSVLRPADGAEGDRFGESVSLDGAQLLVGAPNHDAVGANAGAAYRFTRVGVIWTEDAKLVAPDAAPSDYFGFAVSLDGAMAVVGAYGDDAGGALAGSVHVFAPGLEWARRAEVQASDGAAGDRFGFAVGLSGANVIVGADGDDDRGESSGSAYFYALSSSGAADGSPCTGPSGCFSGFCVDGVCCTTACGGGATDCQVCSVAMGAAADGICSPLPAATAATVVCRASTGGCDGAETCVSVSLDCPPDRPAAAGTVCRPVSGTCDAAEVCDGRTAVCPADVLAPRGLPCRARAGFCDVAERCDGVSAACPSDLFQPDGSLCRDVLVCNGVERCSAGECAGTPLDCDDGDACTADMCEEPTGCRHVPVVECCFADGDCDDGNACTTDACASPPGGSCTHVAIAGCCLDDRGCDDRDSCTADRCADHACAHDEVAGCREIDAGPADAGPPDAGPVTDDAGSTEPDAGPLDAGVVDGGALDAGAEVDAGPPSGGDDGCGCRIVPRDGRRGSWWLAALVVFALLGARRSRRRRVLSRADAWLCSALLIVVVGCGGDDSPMPMPDGSVADGDVDGGELDGGDVDSGILDGGALDAGGEDAGPTDAGPMDADAFDAGPPDAGRIRRDGGPPPLPCNTCHGDDTSIAPPRDTSGNTATTNRGVGAHRSHLEGDGSWYRPLTCLNCHIVPETVEAPGHLDTEPYAELTWWGMALAGGATPAWDGATCTGVYCHGATLMSGGINTTPAWTTVDGSQAACGTCHGLPPALPHPQIATCDACHPTVRADRTFLSPNSHIDGRVNVDLSRLTCTSCHGSGTRAEPPRDVSGSTATSSRGVGAHRSHLDASDWHAPLACDDCHLVPDYIFDIGHADTALPAELLWGWRAMSDGSSPAFDGTTCSYVYCHGATLPGGTVSSPEWTRVDGTQAACGACHGVPPAAPHPASTACGLCHPGPSRTGPGFDDPSLHVNGVLDVKPMECDTCHGSGGVFAPPTDTAGRTATTFTGVGAHRSHLGRSSWHAEIACEECHLVPAAFGDAGHMDTALPAELTWGTLATSDAAIPVWNGTTCAGVYCHGATLAEPGTNMEPTWTVVDGTEAACGTCHRNHLGHGTAECWDCHPFTIAPGGGFANPARHINGVVEALDCLDCHFR